MTSLKSGVKVVLMKKLSLYIFLFFSWFNIGFAESVQDRLDKIEERLDKIENILKSRNTNSINNDSNTQFKSIAGKWINAENSNGEFIQVYFDGQICLIEKKGNSCEDHVMKSLGANKFVWVGFEEQWYFEVDGDLLFLKSPDGKEVFMKMKRTE